MASSIPEVRLRPAIMSSWKSNPTFVLGVTGFLLAASLWVVSADRTIDTDHSTLKIHVGKAGLFSVAGHDHWERHHLPEAASMTGIFRR